jgi:hypothetical protein
LLLKKFPAFFKPLDSLPFSQNPVTGLYGLCQFSLVCSLKSYFFKNNICVIDHQAGWLAEVVMHLTCIQEALYSYNGQDINYPD